MKFSKVENRLRSNIATRLVLWWALRMWWCALINKWKKEKWNMPWGLIAESCPEGNSFGFPITSSLSRENIWLKLSSFWSTYEWANYHKHYKGGHLTATFVRWTIFYLNRRDYIRVNEAAEEQTKHAMTSSFILILLLFTTSPRIC